MKKRKYIKNAKSKQNGIIFYSNEYQDMGINTYRTNDGKIRKSLVTTSTNKDRSLENIINGNQKITFETETIIFNITLISICLLLNNIRYVCSALLFVYAVSYNFLWFIKAAIKMKLEDGEAKSIARYHAAEHMAINAYQKYQRIPTIEEVNNSSRISKGCGSKEIIYKIVQFVSICLILAFYKGDYFNEIVLILLDVAFVGLANEKGWLTFFQLLITEKPSNAEIEVAIEGLKNYEELEEKIRYNLQKEKS